MKKPTNPLPVDLRFGGFLVLPILTAFQRQSNVVTPSGLAWLAGLAEPMASWAIYALHAMGALELYDWGEEARHHTEMSKIPGERHFIPRLSKSRAEELAEHVLANAQAVNANPSAEFFFDMIGVFGSLMSGSLTPGDVDIVYVARYKETGKIIPESDYYPFSRDMPTDRAATVLRRGVRRADVSCHDLREVEFLGAGYQIIWTREEGRVARMVAATKPLPDPAEDGPDGLIETDAKCDAFRRTCAGSPPLLAPVELRLPPDVQPMTFLAWAKALDSEQPVTLLAHHQCSPPGKIKTYLDKLIERRRASEPAMIASAEKQLPSFLAASARFGTWGWNPATGLVKGKPYKKSELRGT